MVKEASATRVSEACGPTIAARADCAAGSVSVCGTTWSCAGNGSGANVCSDAGGVVSWAGLWGGVVWGVVAVFGALGWGGGANLGFSTKATRVRAAGALPGSVAVGTSAGAAMARVCIGPVRSVGGLFSCQSSVPARLSSKPRCNTKTSAPQRSKLRVLGRPDSCAAGGGLGRVGSTVLMGSNSVCQGGVREGGRERARAWGRTPVPLRSSASPGRPTTAGQTHAAHAPPGPASRRRRWPKTPVPPRPKSGVPPHRTRAHTGPKCRAAAH